ncbi:MAG TPA: ribosome biogenesis factor YjgA [Spongiibacteraceae bacterium]|nr:ribosome biogenesis factor YjgA [Spongiibacteraceae bacterium]
MSNDSSEDFFDPEKPSKSARKREMLALQELGEAIVKLSDGELALIPLEGELATAVALARRINNSNEGLRRQLQFIGKLMRQSDISAIEAAYRELQNGRQLLNQQFHRLEQLRDQLLAEGPSAMNEVLELYPQADRQHLRQLINAAVKEREAAQPPAAARKLFRYLREVAEL